MVTKICSLLKINNERPPARSLSEPICHNYATNWYLAYRWIICLVWVSVLICSGLELGSYEPRKNQIFWFIYLTNWDVTLGAFQSILAVIIVTKRWRSQKSPDFDPDVMPLNLITRIYWVVCVATSTMAINITIFYWSAVHNSQIHHVDPLNIMTHIFNSILMVQDILVSKIPFRFHKFWWCAAVMSFYVLFTIIYYFAGGVNKFGKPYVYKILNWKVPERAILVCFIVLLTIITIHCILCALTMLRDRFCKRDHNKVQVHSDQITYRKKMFCFWNDIERQDMI